MLGAEVRAPTRGEGGVDGQVPVLGAVELTREAQGDAAVVTGPGRPIREHERGEPSTPWFGTIVQMMSRGCARLGWKSRPLQYVVRGGHELRRGTGRAVSRLGFTVVSQVRQEPRHWTQRRRLQRCVGVGLLSTTRLSP